MPSRIQFDRLWMDFADRVSRMSHDPSTKVGAVVVRDDRQISIGYNGMPRGIPEPDWLWERPTKYRAVIHAEVNAVSNAPFDTRGCTVYITHQPCPACLGKLINAGIARVVYAEPYSRMPPEDLAIWQFIVEHWNGDMEHLPLSAKDLL